MDTFVSDPNATFDVEVKLDERSRGSKWFFSFYITFAADTHGGNAEKQSCCSMSRASICMPNRKRTCWDTLRRISKPDSLHDTFVVHGSDPERRLDPDGQYR
jgi:hypothetical protein